MPPIPVTFSEETSRLISAAQRLQNDLVDFQVPRLRSCVGPLSLQQNLAAELREGIESFALQVEALHICIGDQKSENGRRELGHIVKGLQDALSQLRRDSRAALLASKRTIDSQSKSQRDELLASAAVTEKQNLNEKSTDDALMRANVDVTEALRRTIALMQGELERSVLSSQMLDASTASLRATSSTHDTLTNLMGTSKQLITALEKSDWIDRVLIISAFVFFVLVVLFVLKQRILDRGLRVAFWWTRFLPDFSGDAALVQMENGSAVLSTSSPVSSVLVTSSLTAVAVTITSSSDPLASAKTLAPDNPISSGVLEATLSVVSGDSAASEPISTASTTESILDPPHVADEL